MAAAAVDPFPESEILDDPRLRTSKTGAAPKAKSIERRTELEAFFNAISLTELKKGLEVAAGSNI